MSQTRIEKPAVATYADHEVITPPNKLRNAVSTVARIDPSDDPVARAEAALAKLSSEFPSWMDAECERLDEARRNIRAAGLNKATCESLFRAAHDIKGEAATFGYPTVTDPADSLCRLIEHSPDMSRIPLRLIDQHVDAVRAIIREGSLPDGAATAEELISRLRQVTDEFLAHENRDRPDYLEGLVGPPLAPSDPAS
jgi:HPt (histidine-containing phosphotransfer) domain-containing protein